MGFLWRGGQGGFIGVAEGFAFLFADFENRLAAVAFDRRFVCLPGAVDRAFVNIIPTICFSVEATEVVRQLLAALKGFPDELAEDRLRSRRPECERPNSARWYNIARSCKIWINSCRVPMDVLSGIL